MISHMKAVRRAGVCVGALLVMLALLSTLVSGCRKGQAGGEGAPPPEVRLGYFGNLTHAQAVLGVSSGEFQQAIAPAVLKTRVFNAGPSLVEALFAREIDIAYVGPGPAISAHGRSGGKEIRVIAGASANGALIVARADSGINTMADLKGRKVATPQLGNTQDLAARHYLINELKQQDVKNVVPVANAEQGSMMARGQIDAAWAPEPWGTRLIVENGAKLIAEEKDLWPNGEVTLAVVIASPRFLEAHPDLVEKMLRVHHSWTQRLQKSPEQYVTQLGDALYALNSKRLPAGVLEKSIQYVKFTDDPLEQTLEAMARWAHELGFAQQQTKIDGLVDLSILKKL